MKEQIIELVGEKLASLDIVIDDVIYEEEAGQKFLRVVLDSEKVLDLNTITMATRMMNPLLDKADLMKEAYILDVYAKSKGDSENER